MFSDIIFAVSRRRGFAHAGFDYARVCPRWGLPPSPRTCAGLCSHGRHPFSGPTGAPSPAQAQGCQGCQEVGGVCPGPQGL